MINIIIALTHYANGQQNIVIVDVNSHNEHNR